MGVLISSIILIIIADGAVSAAEAAIYSVPIHKAKIYAEKYRAGKTLVSLKESMEKPITTLIALSSIITIGGSFYAGFLATRIFDNYWIGIFAGLQTFLLMIFGEIIPKRLGERYCDKTALIIAPPVYFVSRAFTPIIWLIDFFTEPFIEKNKSGATSEAEIKYLAREAAEEGIIEAGESQLIQKIFRLNDITAADIMTPVPLVAFIDGNKTVGETADFIEHSQHSRLPVYEEDKKNIIGIVHQRNLLIAITKRELDQPVKNYAWDAMIVPESRLIDDLLKDMREKRSQLAVVVSEYGDVAGVVGIEDIIEELVGEIVDEKDVEPEMIKRVSKNEVIAHGQTRVSYLNHFFNTEIKNRKTLNGYLMDKIGELPRQGSSFEFDGLKFIIELVGPRTIDRIRIIKNLGS